MTPYPAEDLMQAVSRHDLIASCHVLGVDDDTA